MSRSAKQWLAVITWAALISFFSTDSFSSSHTSRFIIPLLHWILPSASLDTLEFLHFLVRKAAHLTEYFIFSVLLVRTLRGEQRGWKLRWALYAIAIAAGYAALDEFHQSFVASRTASPWDALIDTVGASLGQVAAGLWYRFRWDRLPRDAKSS